MAIKIRLARGGSKKRPHYSIVAADSRMPRDGRFIEKLGTYNPLLPKDSEDRVKMNLERVQYWLSQGAQTTDRGSADQIYSEYKIPPCWKCRNRRFFT